MKSVAHHQDVCKGCTAQTWVNENGYCKDCAHPSRVTEWARVCSECDERSVNVCVECKQSVDVLLEDGKCVVCYFGKDWKEYPPDTLKARQCVSCSRMLVLNKDNICLHCHIENALKRSTKPYVRDLHTCSRCDEYIAPSEELCSRHKVLRRNCADCGDSFVADSMSQWQCHHCLPVCQGCGEKFVPEYRSDALCAECESIKRKGECPKCSAPHEDATVSGLCLDCADDEYVEYASRKDPFTFLCWRCKENEVSSPDEVCQVCRHTHFQCPSCLRQNLDYNDIVCNECKS